jgi:hypothetical protein
VRRPELCHGAESDHPRQDLVDRDLHRPHCQISPTCTGLLRAFLVVCCQPYGGVQPNDVRRLKQLEAENARLKKLVAERDLEIEVMKEVAVSVPACRLAESAGSRCDGPARCYRWQDRR